MLPKLSRETLAEQAVRNLLAFIEQQNLKPGGQLPPETQLAADLGVSRPIIREALKSLEGKGIIEVRNGKSPIIKPLDSEPLQNFFVRATQIEHEAIIDLIELRKCIELQCAALAAERRTDEQLCELAEIAAQMRKHLYEPQRYVELDHAFHEQIAAMTHNQMFQYMVKAMRTTISDVLQEPSRRDLTPEQIDHVQEGHELIYQSIAQRDVAAATSLMAAHFSDATVSLFYSTI
jgi:GntR family transcriptional repressor for pyruvate dehydrogenase complex